MNNHTHTQYTSVLHGNPKQEKTTECFFLYVFKSYIHSKRQLPLFSNYNWRETPTPYFLRIQPKGISNSPILWLQPKGGYNPLCYLATTTCPCPIQPPWHISRMMEPLSHYHYEIYHCKPVPINLNHASTMHQPIPQPVINLYHKQVHQPCTNL